MTLEEAILYYEEQVKKCNNRVNEIILGAERCEQDKQEYTQLAEWLRELQERRKQPGIIRCGECARRRTMCDGRHRCVVFNVIVDSDGYCKWAERRTE